eukprot:g4959.t1
MPTIHSFIIKFPFITPGRNCSPFKCLQVPSTEDDGDEQYVYYGQDPLELPKEVRTPDPSTPCSTPNSATTSVFTDDVRTSNETTDKTTTSHSGDILVTVMTEADGTVDASTSDSTLNPLPVHQRSISLPYFRFNGWTKRIKRGLRNSASDPLVFSGARDPVYYEDRMPVAQLRGLYHSCGDGLGPLPISDPSLLLLHSPCDFINSVGKATGKLSHEEYLFYRNFSGVWRSDTVHSDEIECLFDMFDFPELLKTEAKKVRNLRIQVQKDRVTTLAQSGESLTIDESRNWIGVKSKVKRRDGGIGEAEGWIERYPQGMVLWSQWPDPHAATLCEYLELTADYMHLCSRIEIKTSTGQSFQARIVWHRLLV